MFKESFYNNVFYVNNDKYIYNSISKSFIKNNMNESIQEMIETGSISKNNLEKLVNNGFVVNKNEDEYKAFEYMCKKNFFNDSELNIILVPTMACNFDCDYCFESKHKNIETNKNYFNILKEYAKKYFKLYRHVEISLFGGEPLLVINEIFDYLSFVEELSKIHSFSYSTSITTNGSLLNKTILDKLIYHNCKSIQLTLDGGKKSHNKTRSFKDGRPSFDLLVDKINNELSSYIFQKKFSFNLRINLNNNSVEEIEETLSLISYNIRNNIILILRPIFNTETYCETNSNNLKGLVNYYEIGKKLGFLISKNNYFYRSCESCGNENFFYLLPNLTIWKCINNLSNEIPKIGEISESGEFLLDAKKMFDWYKVADCFDDDKCKMCKSLPDCLGGCILFNAVMGNRLCSPNELVSLPYLY